MKSFLILALLFTIGSEAHAVTIQGKIGTYPIEMDIQTVNWETGDLTGRYRYSDKDAYLELSGTIMQSVVYLEESYNDEVTGTFYLSFEGEELVGKWIGNNKWYETRLELTDEVFAKLQTKTIEDFQKETNSAISGGYADEAYYINDMWFQEDHPQLEVGFSGGTLVLEELNKDSLQFQVSVVCGPTYHIAMTGGIAHRISKNTYLFVNSDEAYEGDTCKVKIELSPKAAYVSAVGGFVCGFGARAYLDHHFTKITNRYEYDAEEVFLDDLKSR